MSRTPSRVAGERLQLPAGGAIAWSGQYEEMLRVRERLLVVVPLTLLLIVVLLYLNTRSVGRRRRSCCWRCRSRRSAPSGSSTSLGYNMSVGVWVGLIALLGVDAETGVFMLLYLDLAYAEAKREGRLRNLAELREAIMDGAVRRLRPKFMTVATMAIGLLPIMWSTGTGSDVMKRIAAPMIGGIVTSFLLELLIYPPLFQFWKWHTEVRVEERS